MGVIFLPKSLLKPFWNALYVEWRQAGLNGVVANKIKEVVESCLEKFRKN